MCIFVITSWHFDTYSRSLNIYSRIFMIYGHSRTIYVLLPMVMLICSWHLKIDMQGSQPGHHHVHRRDNTV